MQGFISSWKQGNDQITRCPQGDVFPFDLSGVSDNELFIALQQDAPFSDPGSCPGGLQVQFDSQGGMAADIQRSSPQVTWQEF